jgi:hypothetical protein
VRDRIAVGAALTRAAVRQTALDAYLPDMKGRRMLMKVDAEGAEGVVLDGARQAIEQLQPLVIFESTVLDEYRDAVFARFAAFGYGVWELPWPPARRQAPLSADAFRHTRQTNFVAVPRGRKQGQDGSSA